MVWLMDWYRSRCDGDWEHAFGVRIDTIDNPGWTLEVNLEGTARADAHVAFRKVARTEHDWLHVKVENGVYDAAGGPSNLAEMILQFSEFIESTG
ncbi:MAG: uncharacterized protein JWP97_4354 [Labilithrix sp.]|nr:uncharacterized protein [Labilithrix sp.]